MYCLLKELELNCQGNMLTLIFVNSNWNRFGLVGRTNTAGKSFVFDSTCIPTQPININQHINTSAFERNQSNLSHFIIEQIAHVCSCICNGSHGNHRYKMALNQQLILKVPVLVKLVYCLCLKDIRKGERKTILWGKHDDENLCSNTQCGTSFNKMMN